VLDPRDRRDLACLGLMVLVYGLAGAPVLHAVVEHAGGLGGGHPAAHAHVHTHEDPGEPGHAHPDEDPGHPHQHAPGAVEHLQAIAVTHAAVLAPIVWWFTLKPAVFLGPRRLPGALLRLTAMPQGP
jgi:hypothetical protein